MGNLFLNLRLARRMRNRAYLRGNWTQFSTTDEAGDRLLLLYRSLGNGTWAVVREDVSPVVPQMGPFWFLSPADIQVIFGGGRYAVWRSEVEPTSAGFSMRAVTPA